MSILVPQTYVPPLRIEWNKSKKRYTVLDHASTVILLANVKEEAILPFIVRVVNCHSRLVAKLQELSESHVIKDPAKQKELEDLLAEVQ